MSEPAVKDAHLWARDPLDWYVEEERCTEQLLKVEEFLGTIWDPCCGGGNTVRACLRAGYDAIGSDLVTRKKAKGQPWFRGERDFLTADVAGNLILNPPFFRAKGTEAFIRHALKIAKGKVAVFCDIKFLAGTNRANGLWREHPPTRVWIISPRPSCPPGAYIEAGNEPGGGTADWVWCVWDQTAPTTLPALGWLRRAA